MIPIPRSDFSNLYSGGYYYSLASQDIVYTESWAPIPQEEPSALSFSASHKAQVPQPFAKAELPLMPPLQNRLALPTVEGIAFVKITDIVRLEADGNYTTIILQSGERYCVSRIMKDFEMLLPANRFFRPHQSHLISLDAVCKFLREDGGYVLMTDKYRVPVSRRRKDELMDWLRQGSMIPG